MSLSLKQLQKRHARAVGKAAKWAAKAKALESMMAGSGAIESSLRPLAIEQTLPGRVTVDQYDFRSVDRREFTMSGKYYGVLSHISRKLGVSLPTVRGVSKGQWKSERVEEALIAEMKLRDAEALLPKTPSVPPFTPEERRLFRPGQRYYGALTIVAARLGLSASHLRNVKRGLCSPPVALTALREEMARIDTEIAANQEVSK